jgi:integrase
MLHKAFEYACKQGYLNKNPSQYADPPRAIKKEIILPTDDEIKMIYDATENTIYFLPIYIASVTGMRLSEICGLQNSDIDLQKEKFFVRHTLKRIKGKMEISTTKTHGSQRNIPFLDGTRSVLEDHIKSKRQLKMQFRSIWIDNNSFCNNNDGSPIQPDSLSKAFRMICKKLNISGITFHSIRHYHATWLLRQRVNPKVVSERLGHAKIQITLDTYTHLIPGIQEDAIANLNTDLFQIKDKKKQL